MRTAKLLRPLHRVEREGLLITAYFDQAAFEKLCKYYARRAMRKSKETGNYEEQSCWRHPRYAGRAEGRVMIYGPHAPTTVSTTDGERYTCTGCGRPDTHPIHSHRDGSIKATRRDWKDTWQACYNVTRKQWMVWRDGSPAIAYCYVQADAETIARLLNAAGQP